MAGPQDLPIAEILGSKDLKSNEKLYLEETMKNVQYKDFMRTFNTIVDRCFVDCVHNFRTKKLEEKEELCVFRCTEKYLKYSGKVGLVFAEQMKDQPGLGP